MSTKKGENKKMERTKDIFYYIGDFLACVLILSLMYFLISWKLGDSLPVSYETGKARAEAARQAEEKKVVIESKGPIDSKTGDNNAALKDGDKKTGLNTGDKKDVSKPDEADKKEEKKDGNQNGVVTVTVESGMSAVDIAYMLEEKGLVDSADLFVAKLESLDLTSSLQIGDFQMKKGLSYEEVAAILTGN